jgi:hypothetical protein
MSACAALKTKVAQMTTPSALSLAMGTSESSTSGIWTTM